MLALQEELSSWYENLSEGLQATDKAQRLDECVGQIQSALDNLTDPPALLKTLTLVYLPGLIGGSRRARAAEVNSQLMAIVTRSQSVVSSTIDLIPLASALGLTAQQVKNLESLITESEEYIEALEESASEVESLDIPGMYD